MAHYDDNVAHYDGDMVHYDGCTVCNYCIMLVILEYIMIILYNSGTIYSMYVVIRLCYSRSLLNSFASNDCTSFTYAMQGGLT